MIFLLLAGVLGGCSQVPKTEWDDKRAVRPPPACVPMTREQELAINLSQDMIDSGKLHAAYANLDLLPRDLPEARLRKARVLRLLGRPEAGEQFNALLRTCLVAEGRHGLGQLALAAGDADLAMRHLRTAVLLDPVDAAKRNDLGVAYLRLRDLPRASFELRTAMELDEGSNHAAQNYVTLLLYGNDWERARELVASFAITPEQFTRAEQRARALRGADAPASAQAQAAPGVTKPAVVAPPAPPVVSQPQSVTRVVPRSIPVFAPVTTSPLLRNPDTTEALRPASVGAPALAAPDAAASAALPAVPSPSAASYMLRAPASAPPAAAVPGAAAPRIPLQAAPAAGDERLAAAEDVATQAGVQRIRTASGKRVAPPAMVPIIRAGP
ncbi:hypothetical protein [Stutzerimonas kirkiae]|uniref:hypothetical protein n=1 Tax=Stutzerimonas kirkiae TaxID=2211392 RepID=UPI0015F2C52C|nr:hypothetical protein [Stutzerimonas kirkiae]